MRVYPPGYAHGEETEEGDEAMEHEEEQAPPERAEGNAWGYGMTIFCNLQPRSYFIFAEPRIRSE